MVHPKTAAPEPIRLSRVAPWGIGGAVVLLGLFLLVRLALDRPPPKKHSKESLSAAQETPRPAAALPWAPERMGAVLVPMVDVLQTTQSVLAERGPDCLACAEHNGCFDPAQEGGGCEQATGAAPGCGDAVTERDVCYKVLRDVFTSGCAQSLQETPCLCGTTDAVKCITGEVTPNGPIFQDYACDFRTNDTTVIYRDFNLTNYGAGRANSLVQCVAAYDCKCFGR